MEKITLMSLIVEGFRKFDRLKLDNIGHKFFIVGNNSTGKSSLLNAITWGMVDSDIWGNSMDPMKNGVNFTSVQSEITNGKNKMFSRRISSKKGSKKENNFVPLSFHKVEKDVAIPLMNPRYLLELSPAGIKTLLSKTIIRPYSIIEDDFNIEQKNIRNSVDSLLDTFCSVRCDELAFIGARIADIEKLATAINTKQKEFAEQSLIYEGKIKGIQDFISLMNESGAEISTETDMMLNSSIMDAEGGLIVAQEQEAKMKENAKIIKEYKTAFYSILAKWVNESLKKTQICIEKDGKDVFIVTYNGINVKSVSYSEQLKAGLELVNALVEEYGVAYPVLVDNGESVIDLDMKDYPNIHQIIATLVSENELSTYDEGLLTKLSDNTSTLIALEEVRVNVKILDGWGTK